MENTHVRQDIRPRKPAEFHVLVLEQDINFAQTLKFDLEKKLPVEVTTVSSISIARAILRKSPDKFFLSVSSVVNFDSESFEKIDLLAEFQIPAIVIVAKYEDDLRDQLIKRHVIDYVVKDANRSDTSYICDLIARLLKNISIKVLVVDDSKVAQFVISRELALQKFEVLQVDNGLEAIEILEKNQDIRLVLVDYQMKMVDGVTFVKKARELYPKDQISIIGISSSADPRLAVKFLKAGANDFISKPFNYEMMLCRINQNLDMLEAIDYAKHLSNVDYLSNVYNRRYFFEQGNKLFRDLGRNDVLTVMMVDIDIFKKINDEYGHDVGDQVIKGIAGELKSHFKDDIVARMGGEEFAVVSLNPDYLYSFANIEAFREKIAQQSIALRGRVIKYTCSIGVSNILGKSLDDMLRHADRLLYIAKQSGRNRVEGNPAGKSTNKFANTANGFE
jgi:diguanylate cyclase (GGDEF)-like protein